jgi:hypothetical protein
MRRTRSEQKDLSRSSHLLIPKDARALMPLNENQEFMVRVAMFLDSPGARIQSLSLGVEQHWSRCRRCR